MLFVLFCVVLKRFLCVFLVAITVDIQ